MSTRFEGLLPGHEGIVGLRLADGSLRTQGDGPEDPAGYRAACSCGWTGAVDYPPTEEGRWSVGSEWGKQHMLPIWSAAPPEWLLNRSDILRDNVAELATTWPLQALGILAEIERWQKPLIERAVAAAREAGLSWAEIGTALGVTRQSAHERFSAALRKKPPA